MLLRVKLPCSDVKFVLLYNSNNKTNGKNNITSHGHFLKNVNEDLFIKELTTS